MGNLALAVATGLLRNSGTTRPGTNLAPLSLPGIRRVALANVKGRTVELTPVDIGPGGLSVETARHPPSRMGVRMRGKSILLGLLFVADLLRGVIRQAPATTQLAGGRSSRELTVMQRPRGERPHRRAVNSLMNGAPEIAQTREAGSSESSIVLTAMLRPLSGWRNRARVLTAGNGHGAADSRSRADPTCRDGV